MSTFKIQSQFCKVSIIMAMHAFASIIQRDKKPGIGTTAVSGTKSYVKSVLEIRLHDDWLKHQIWKAGRALEAYFKIGNLVDIFVSLERCPLRRLSQYQTDFRRCPINTKMWQRNNNLLVFQSAVEPDLGIRHPISWLASTSNFMLGFNIEVKTCASIAQGSSEMWAIEFSVTICQDLTVHQ